MWNSSPVVWSRWVPVKKSCIKRTACQRQAVLNFCIIFSVEDGFLQISHDYEDRIRVSRRIRPGADPVLIMVRGGEK
ncbi:hypothetical protein SAMN05421790_10110 [Kroppenstedtia eburnea]|uniref:Uncharacterized protein n=1 Tax=Kroppenstedtia eburnea TaxID=714067 RepID=A0A1N7IK64_9BACL|nr:hypothetical protein SAMN05421790_10110 [Kroppenstedtia eburnea]